MQPHDPYGHPQPETQYVQPETQYIQPQMQQHVTGYVQVPMAQNNVIILPSPRYQNTAVRAISYSLMGIGFLTFFIGIMAAMSNPYSPMADLGGFICCGFLWAAMIPEVIFYHGMMNHNAATGQGTGWAATNLVFGYLILIGGGIYLLFALMMGAAILGGI